ncbi:hypothetical protein BH11BAC6_BH11BAC6_01030 [soil metagenome]
MKKIFTLFVATTFAALSTNAQNIFPSTGSAGIGTAAPNTSSILEMVSTLKGLLIPRMTKTQRDSIPTPATGLMIYQTNSTPGFYYYSGTAWNAVTAKGANTSLSNLKAPLAINQSLLPNADNTIDAGSPTLNLRNIYLLGSIYQGSSRIINLNGNNSALGFGTLYNLSIGYGNTATGNSALYANTNGNRNTANGHLALYSNTTGNYNAALGSEALYANTIGDFNTANGFYALNKNTTGDRNTANGSYSMYNNTTGRLNVAVGVDALNANTTGSGNTANGFEALRNNTTGYSNVAVGIGALQYNTTGHNLVAIGDSALFNQGATGYYFNTAVGSKALYSNTTGYRNTANGYNALYSNTGGTNNTANGYYALYSNTTGAFNTANGVDALIYNTTGFNNTANGFNSLFRNTTGYNNTANGEEALFSNTTGIENTANGYQAFYFHTTGDYNTANGSHALYSQTTGSKCTALGYRADIFSSSINSTAIGYYAYVGTSDEVRLGNNAVTSIGGFADWTNISDGRVKKNIKENVPGLAFINKLKPVTYNLNLDAADKIVQRPEIKDKDGKAIQEKPSADQLASRKAKEQIIYTGFVAQDVEQAAKELSYDFSGVDAAKNDKDLYGLRYASFVVPLVKAVQELSKSNDDKDAKIDNLQKQIDDLKAMITGKQTAIAGTASLEQNTPNPFNHSTTIGYTLPRQYSNAKIIITDNAGRSLKEINISGNGKGSVSVDASLFSNGSYHYSMYIDGKIISSKQMILTK